MLWAGQSNDYTTRCLDADQRVIQQIVFQEVAW